MEGKHYKRVISVNDKKGLCKIYAAEVRSSKSGLYYLHHNAEINKRHFIWDEHVSIWLCKNVLSKCEKYPLNLSKYDKFIIG